MSQAKLIAEPWDVGQMDSYDLGRFPPLWREWNGKYRDTMRDFWRSHPVGIGEFATRFSGSADLYATGGPPAHRLGQPDHRPRRLHPARPGLLRRQAQRGQRRESNRDGTSDNRSWNCGAEGPTTDPGILALRARQSRAMLTTLLLSFGVPMLLGGDEMGRTQQGNNNAYCQDNEIAWLDWSQPDTELQDFTRRLIAFRKAHPVFRRRRFLAGAEASELRWFTPAGTEMTAADWSDRERPGHRALPGRLRRPGPGRKTARRCSTTTSSSWSTPGGSRSTSPSPPPAPGRPGRPRSTPTTPPDPPPRPRSAQAAS